jgi:7-cyano-7-deazaguanine synthase
VRRLQAAGAVVIGKTNLDQFATGLSGTRSPYGACESPLVPGLISGGSSSGSAVAVAAGLVPVAIGTDTAGSGRVPTLAYWLASHGTRLTLLSVDYGQRHGKELLFAARTAAALGAVHHVADLRLAGQLLGGSALTSAAVPVPDGHYTDESMRAMVVPNRNALLLDLATGLAVSTGAGAVAYGAHAGDHAVYPDCRPEFVAAYQHMALTANAGFLPGGFTVLAPFIAMTKADIASLAARLGVPVDQTWSCYRGGDAHCGTCGTCTERREAFALAGINDPTAYLAG